MTTHQSDPTTAAREWLREHAADAAFSSEFIFCGARETEVASLAALLEARDKELIERAQFDGSAAMAERIATDLERVAADIRKSIRAMAEKE